MKVAVTLILAVLFLASCGDDKGEAMLKKLDAEIEAARYKPAAPTIDTLLFTGEKKKLWMLETDSFPAGKEKSNFYMGFTMRAKSSWVKVQYDYSNSNDQVQYFISKDTLVLDFGGVPAVRFKYLVSSMNDSVMMLKDIQNEQFELEYRSQHLDWQELNN